MASLGVACERADLTVARTTHAPELLQLVQPGRWRAANAQATQLVGNVAIREIDASRGEITLAFTHGVTIWARPAPLPGDDAAVRGLLAQMRDALGAPEDVFPTAYAVTDERIAPSAPAGGLCGGVRTRIVALAIFEDESGASVMRLASFHQGFSAPAPGAAAVALKPCFAFDFAGREAY